MRKLAIVTTHPIQYNAPVFRLLAERARVQIRVFYTWSQTEEGLVYDPAFKIAFKWDIPLLEGYEYEFVNNESTQPGSNHYKGIVNSTLIPILEKWQPDGVLVYGWSFKSHLQVIRQFKGKIPVFFRGDSTLLDEAPGFSIKKLIRKIFLKWVYSHIDFALYVGSANKEYFSAHGLKEKQLLYAPHAIDGRRFSDHSTEMSKLSLERRAQLRIPDSSIVLLFAGKLEPKKNPLLLVEVFIELNRKDIHLIIAGNGELENAIKELANGRTNIHMIGFQNQREMPIVYRMADLFVLPSAGPGETWGLAINEAMAVGLPVVVSDACGAALDLVYADNVGRIVRRNNRSDLYKAIALMIEKGKEGLAQMGESAKAHIGKFSFQKIASAVESALLKSSSDTTPI